MPLDPSDAPIPHLFIQLPKGYVLAGIKPTPARAAMSACSTFAAIWMPDRFAEGTHTLPPEDKDQVWDSFCGSYCRGCRYNTEQVTIVQGDDDFDDSIPDVTSYTIPGCDSYHRGPGDACFGDDGYCKGGHERPYLDPDQEGESTDFTFGPTVFSATFLYDKYSPFWYIEEETDQASLQSPLKEEDDTWLFTAEARSINTFSDHICWGGNNAPDTLSGMVDIYAGTPANDDLLFLEEYESNVRRTRDRISKEEAPLGSPCSQLFEPGYDAIACVHLEQDTPLAESLAMAGFPPQEALVALPLKLCFVGGAPYFRSDLDDTGRYWLFSSHEEPNACVIAGQVLPEELDTPTPPSK